VALTKKELEVLDILCKNINKNISYEYLKDISNSTVRDDLPGTGEDYSHPRDTFGSLR
jgi:hypothetical protein